MLPETKRKIKTTVGAALGVAFAGFCYPLIFPPQNLSGMPSWHPSLNCSIIGFCIGLAIAFGELYVFQTRLRHLRFPFLIIVQTLYYLVAVHASVIGVFGFHYALLRDWPFADVFRMIYAQNGGVAKEFLIVTGYSLAVIFFVTFHRQVNRTLGQNALLFFLTGKYHKPVEEERVFMFLDLKASTAIAEKLGHTRYHSFLNDFFYDITPAIIENKGEIYQYVGDEIVVTWTKERGLRNANCINCYFGVVGAIAKLADAYEKKYGFVPEFKAGYHSGTVTAGLIGDIKRDIVFHGDTVNTAARIRSECSVVNRNLLLSGQLREQLAELSYVTLENMGKIRLRGKQEEISLYSVKEAA
jgi:adenylate cyclase